MKVHAIQLCLLILLLAACSPVGSQHPCPRTGVETAVSTSHSWPTIFHLAEGLTAQLRANFREGDFEEYDCVIATLVDIDDLTRSSRFGRLMAEALGAEIFRQGGRVTDIRSGDAFMVQPQKGELVLSRDAGYLAGDVHAGAVVAGTYGVGATSVAVTIRLIDLTNHRLLSIAMTEIARTPTIDVLLHGTSGPVPTAYDRLY